MEQQFLSSGKEINKFKYSTPKIIPMATKKSHSPTSQVFSKYTKLCSMKIVSDVFKRWHSAMLVYFCPNLYFPILAHIISRFTSMSTDSAHRHTCSLYAGEQHYSHPLLSVTLLLIVLAAQTHQLNFNQLNATHPNERSKFKTLLASRRAF